jgi:hypothetical protein
MTSANVNGTTSLVMGQLAIVVLITRHYKGLFNHDFDVSRFEVSAHIGAFLDTDATDHPERQARLRRFE